jgi:methyl-accepting chemotaxis protein
VQQALTLNAILRRWFDLPLGWKIAVPPALALAGLIAVSAVGYLGLRTAAQSADHLNDVALPTTEHAANVELQLVDLNAQVYRVLTLSAAGFSSENVDAALSQVNATSSEVQRLIEAQLDSEIWTVEQRARLKALLVDVKGFSDAAAQALDMRDAGLASAASFLTIADESFAKVTTGVEALRADQRRLAQESANLASDASRRTVQLLVLTVLLASAAAVLSAWSVGRRLLVRLRQARLQLSSLASGDLDGALGNTNEADTLTSRDETDQLLGSLRRVAHELSQLVSQIQRASEHVSTAAAQIAAGNSDLSARTESNAASLQETAATTEELSATTASNSARVERAQGLAAKAADASQAGQAAVGNAVATMERLKSESTRIREMVQSIEGLAFQTNLLSLNAAVEAARAGSHGRGFAVVAAEVRQLAQKSTLTASEIRGVVADSVAAIESSNANVQLASNELVSLQSMTTQVAAEMEQVTSASREQAQGVVQINGVMADLDQSTQRNAALVEQASAASHSLRESAQRLHELVASFRLAEPRSRTEISP